MSVKYTSDPEAILKIASEQHLNYISQAPLHDKKREMPRSPPKQKLSPKHSPAVSPRISKLHVEYRLVQATTIGSDCMITPSPQQNKTFKSQKRVPLTVQRTKQM